MPTYEFRCPQGHEFEKFYRSIGGAEAQAACPQCALPAERLMSAAGFAFKGSGFYLTDYGKNAHRDKGTPESKNGAATGDAAGDNGKGSESSKADSKSDAAAAAPAAAPAAGSSPGSGAAAEKQATQPSKTESKTAGPAPKKSAGE